VEETTKSLTHEKSSFLEVKTQWATEIIEARTEDTETIPAAEDGTAETGEEAVVAVMADTGLVSVGGIVFLLKTPPCKSGRNTS
jgi:hypothetical protein